MAEVPDTTIMRSLTTIVANSPLVLTLALLAGGAYAADDAGHGHAPAAAPAAAHAPAPAPATPTAQGSAVPTPNEALRLLIEGNERYVADSLNHPNSNAARRCETFTGGQHPIASILSCADSRVPPEMLFDQGIGDLFVIRVAGNVADVDEIGTLEYGIEHLHTPLVVVMGHSKCGAVTAVVQHAHVSKNIEKLVDNIVPAVESVKATLPGAKGDTLVNAAIDANVLQSIADLIARSPDARELIAAGKVKVVGAVYDIHTGSIRWLGEHPQQAQLLKAAPADIASTPSHASDAHAPTGHAPAAREPADAHGTHGKEAAHPTEHSEKHTTSSHDADPHAAADSRPLAPHQSGTLKGMMIPAAFLGGAGLASGAIFKFFMSRPAAAKSAGAGHA